MELRPDAASDDGDAKPAAKTQSKARRAWVTPDELNVTPALLGATLASPWRRLMAITVDLAAIALLSKLANFWLLAAVALAAWLLVRKRPVETAARKNWLVALAWVGVAAMSVAGMNQAWNTRDSFEFDEDKVVTHHGGSAAHGKPGGASAAVSRSKQEPAPAAAPAPAPAASSVESLQAKVTELESALEKASKPKPLSLKSAVASWSDDLGLGLGWTVLYFSVLPVWWKGQTLGKRLFKMRTVELTGKPITVLLAFKRYGGYAAGVSTGMFGFLQVLWDSNRQALHDKAAHTVVLDLRAEAVKT